ncbi:suppressor of fused domain protein [Rhizobium leguminosarum]|uniref:suppressor of fused domain protein n=1 Tax=Rhizobium leguminosarum TaxID=384 RepID=UPI0036DF84A4
MFPFLRACSRRRFLAMTLASSAAPARPARSAWYGKNGETATMPGAETTSLNAYRRTVYENELEEPGYSFSDDRSDGIEIHAFGRDFAPVGTDEGYVLLTNGMSDRRMTLPASHREKSEKPRAELMWYVREPTPEIIVNLRWLAELPFMDATWFGFGHRVPMPTPPVAGCDFRTFLFLTPIIETDQRIAEALMVENDPVEILTVNLISDAEYRFIKEKRLDPFLDMLDEEDYPPIFDPKRKSYL